METLLNPEFLLSQVFWLVVSFALLLLVVWKFVTPALTQTLDDRARQIREDLDKAAELKADAEAALKEYNEKLQSAHEEAVSMLATARKEAEDLAAERTKALEADLKRKENSATHAIAQAQAKAMEELRTHVAELTVLATEKAIRAQLDAAKAEEYTLQAIHELKA